MTRKKTTRRRSTAEAGGKRKATPKHEDREHAPLPPSASSRWLKCPPSQGYIRRLIDEGIIEKRVSGPAAERGTRIHEISEPMLHAITQGKKPRKPKGDKSEIAIARSYVAFCQSAWEDAIFLDEDAQCGIEGEAFVNDDNWGKVDFWILCARRLSVIDLKTGREFVECEGNTQLLNYAMGLVRKMKLKDVDEVEVCIWQPDPDDDTGEHTQARSHVYSLTEFVEHCKRLNRGIEEAASWLRKRGHEKALIAGDHCGWCDALGVCPKAKEHNLAIATKDFAPVDRVPATLPDPTKLEAWQVSEIMSRAPMFTAWLGAVQERALELYHKGHEVPGHKCVRKMTRRAWEGRLTPGAIAKKLGLKLADITEQKLMSPAKVEKLLPKNKREKLKPLVFKPVGEPVMVPESHRAQAIPNAKLLFQPVTREEEDDG